jgi:hypothetical protein
MNYDLWALPLNDDRKPFPVVQTMFDERDGQFSPNGEWIAYQSNEPSHFEIFVKRFPLHGGEGGGKLQVSSTGGAQVRWRPDGKELFYIGLDGRLMVVPVRFSPGERTIELAQPVPLFATRIGGALQGNLRQQYMVSPDGQRFLMNTISEGAAVSPITLLLNWKAKLK